MKIFKKKAVVTALCSLVIVSGAIGIAVANAEPDNWLAVRYEDKITEAFVGETVSIEGVLPVYPDKVDDIYFEVKDPDGMSVQVEADTFSVGKVGDYRVYVCVLGYGGSVYTESYILSATKSETPILTQAPVLPVAFLEGSVYDVPTAVFTDYNTETPSVSEYQVYLSDKNGQDVAVNGKLSPEVSLHQDVAVLKYVAKSSVTNKEAVAEYTVPVLKAISEKDKKKVYQFDKMFATSGGIEKTEVADNGAMFYGKGTYSFAYANKVKTSKTSFGIVFKSLTGYFNFNKVTLFLTDVLNKNQQITVEILENYTNSTALVRVNGESTFTINGSLKSERTGLGILFDERAQSLTDINSNTICRLNTNAKGQEFQGFSSGFVNVEVAVESGTAYSAIGVYSLNGQSFAIGNERDRIFPYCEAEIDLVKNNSVGDTLTIRRGSAYDIVDPNAEMKVTVRDVNKKIITSVDNVLLDSVSANKEYQIILSDLGEYRVQYTVKDASGNEFSSTYTVYAVDTIAPTLSFVQPMQSNVTIGEEVAISELEYSDNITAKENLSVLITLTLPNDAYKILEIGSKYTFTLAGVYTVRYTVFDEAFNFTTIEQTLYCKEA